jgi:hypothetical protein
LLAAGIANFLHLRDDALRFVDAPAIAAHIRRSPVIRRRSGVEKFEIDLRRKHYRIASAPLELAAVVFVSKKRAAGAALLAPLSPAQCIARLTAGQPYAAGLPEWSAFTARASRLPAFELRRGPHPKAAARALRGLLEWGQTAR